MIEFDLYTAEGLKHMTVPKAEFFDKYWRLFVVNVKEVN